MKIVDPIDIETATEPAKSNVGAEFLLITLGLIALACSPAVVIGVWRWAL